MSNLPPESALAKAENPAAVWSVGEHLLAVVATWLGQLTYITAVVNSEEKAAKRMSCPEPIVRPGETPQKAAVRRRGPRPRIGPAWSPAQFGGVPIETTGEEVRT